VNSSKRSGRCCSMETSCTRTSMGLSSIVVTELHAVFSLAFSHTLQITPRSVSHSSSNCFLCAYWLHLSEFFLLRSSFWASFCVPAASSRNQMFPTWAPSLIWNIARLCNGWITNSANIA
jgi:hypothetical protein